MPALDTQTPLTITLPMPQPIRVCVTIPSGWKSGAGVIACADVATAKAKPAAAINLIIVFLPFFDLSTGKNTDGIVECKLENGFTVKDGPGGTPVLRPYNGPPDTATASPAAGIPRRASAHERQSWVNFEGRV
jgi:hypothetical protein